mgnify:CR=1 FL=1
MRRAAEFGVDRAEAEYGTRRTSLPAVQPPPPLTASLARARASSPQVCAVKAPGFGDNRKATLQDLAVLTGAQVVSEDVGLKLENVTEEMLGTAKKVGAAARRRSAASRSRLQSVAPSRRRQSAASRSPRVGAAPSAASIS